MSMYNVYLSTSAVATVLLIIATTILIRLVFVIRSIQNDRRRDINILQTTSDSNKDNIDNKKQQQVKTMIILGSGGHTTEMIRLLQELDPCTYTPVVYVLAESDTTSIERLQKYIKEEEDDGGDDSNDENKQKRSSSSRWIGRYPIEKSSNHSSSIDSSKQSTVASVYRLPRAREVHQSYYTSILTTIHSFLQTLILLNKVQPELLLTNGPGTCIPVIYSLFLHRILSFRSSNKRSCKIIFVESLCRVQTLSLSGKLVYPIVDRFIVHWPYLKQKYPLVDVCDVFIRHDGNNVDSIKDE